MMWGKPDPREKLAAGVAKAREATLVFLRSLQAKDQPAGVMRISPLHDPRSWPGVLLPVRTTG